MSNFPCFPNSHPESSSSQASIPQNGYYRSQSSPSISLWYPNVRFKAVNAILKFYSVRLTLPRPSIAVRNTLRVFRTRIFLNDEAMSVALQYFQEKKPDLWGTLEELRSNRPPRYVDVYDPNSRESTYMSTDELRKIEEEQNKKIEENAKAGIERAILQTAVSPPKHMHHIPLEVVEGGDSSTFFSEVSNMLNVPFGEGAPLMNVRIVRHAGGSDLLVSAHQSLFDESSFDAACTELLELYTIAAEGRFRDLKSDTDPILWDVDSMYPSNYRKLLEKATSSFGIHASLKRLAVERSWDRLPFQTDSMIPGTYLSVPPSPTLNSTATMFGTLSLKDSRKLTKMCRAKGLSVSSAIAAAAVRQTSSVIASSKLKRSKDTPKPSPGLLSKLLKLLGQPEEAKQAPEKPVNFIAGFTVSLRDFFDPPIDPKFMGPLSSYMLMPCDNTLEAPFWNHAKAVQDLTSVANVNSTMFYDMVFLPQITSMAADDSRWTHPSIPTVWVSETTSSTIGNDMRLRLQIYDTHASTSCWNPGVSISSRIDAEMIHVSISYRRPLIEDATAKNMLSGILKNLSL